MACAGKPPKDVELQINDYPTGWPPLNEKSFSDDECPKLDGTYQSGGESNSNLSDRFSKPIFERNYFGLDKLANRDNYFTIRADFEDRRLHFEFFSSENILLAAGYFKQYDYCESGWFVNESSTDGGSGDNPTKSTFEKSQYGRGSDGSFLSRTYYQVESSKFFIGRESNIYVIWDRFEPLEELIP